MPPRASIIVPTRRRRAYLEVALASVAPQASAHGAEIVVVEDDPADPATEAIVTGHGGRYVAHGAPRGINVARNTGVAEARGALLCFLDDDVEAWPGWLGALLGAAGGEHEVLGGPIRPRFEGGRLHACGREPLPVTSLDLGGADRDADFVWGANMAVRREAFERLGTFDERLGGAGDEEDWQRRLRAAGGRIRYVAAAGVDHRRAGPDARIPSLARASWHRGRASRRWDVVKGTQPPLPGELRTLAGCAWHVVRRRCGVGIVLTALSAGRVAEALARHPIPDDRDGLVPPTQPPGDRAAADFLSGRSGTLGRRTLATGLARDLAARAVALPRRAALRRAAARMPRRRVLVLAFARPEHARTARAVANELHRSRHDVELVRVVPAAGAGKWSNLNAALAEHPAAGHDWLVLADDDVVLPRGFLDAFLFLAERFGLRLAQPAHAHASHAAWGVTRRRPGVVARRTRFVEIGPVTAIHADAFGALLPFPDLQMGWGLDAHWGAVAAEHGWPVGIVDATPVRHLRPVAAAYPREAAIAEAEAFLDGRAYVTREQAGEVLEAHRRW